jgi:formylglycine-generating enzyme required for sulfatase activity
MALPHSVVRCFVALAVGSIATPPRARTDTPARALSSRSVTPLERALSGGLVLLRTPGSTMIRVPRATFTMGSTGDEIARAVASCARDALGYRCDESTFTSELPRHSEKLDTFFLDRTEVTAADYDRCAAVGRCPARSLEGGARKLARKDLPATLVTAHAAEAYCRARGARLPTEAEYELAARGTSGRTYPWGNLYNDRLANHGRLGIDASDGSDGFAELAPVGSFVDGSTPEGFMDLAGNAAEWTSDMFTTHYGAKVDPAFAGARVTRGGDFMSGSAWLRGAARVPLTPERALPSVGFRCARSLERDD